MPNKRYAPEFKQTAVETVREERLGVCEAMRRFEINDHEIIERWNRIYPEEGSEGLAIERRGRKSSSRPAKLSKAKTLLPRTSGCVRRSITLKICKPWFWKKSDASTENAGSPKTEAEIFAISSARNRSPASCHLLLPLEANAQGR